MVVVRHEATNQLGVVLIGLSLYVLYDAEHEWREGDKRKALLWTMSAIISLVLGILLLVW